MRTKYRLTVLMVLLVASFVTIDLYSSVFKYKIIEMDNISRYWENRIAYQHIQIMNSVSNEADDSISSLLIIRDNQIYVIKDGFDDINKIQKEAYIQEASRELSKSLWINKINAKPDFIKISDRRIERLLNVSEEYVNKNFGNFYINVRNAFITKHVNIFKYLMIDRIEAEMVMNRNPLPPPLFQEGKEPLKYSVTVSAKASNGIIYYAEDVDGDDITETFYVDFNDGFNWGYESGPNIIYIYNNKEDDLKQIIGSLTHEAYYGLAGEEKMLLKTFPTDTEIINEYELDKVTEGAVQSSGSKQ